MIWPFKPKMTVDHLASVFARAMEGSVQVYQEAFDNHAAENIQHIDKSVLEAEAWIMEMFLLGFVIEEIRAPVLVKSKLLPMVLVGYAPLNKEWYLSRELFYRLRLQAKNIDERHCVLASALIEAIHVEFKSTRESVNEQTLNWAISLVIRSSEEGIYSLLYSALTKYRIY